ncbi:MAG: hypothetical protein Q9162_000452 [Coniocarpon cinnabarinum]
MSDNPGLNSLLKWSIRNSETSRQDATSQDEPQAERDPNRGLNPEALAELMGGPSDADRMKESMAAIQSPDVDLANKEIAFDNFEQLIENIDNANNMESLGLWMSLVGQLEAPEPQMRSFAAWCVATAVSNNQQGQERALVLDAVPKLVELAQKDRDKSVRKKAVLALSSEVRNYRPGFEALIKALPSGYVPNSANLDPNDMDAVDAVITKMREDAMNGD